MSQQSLKKIVIKGIMCFFSLIFPFNNFLNEIQRPFLKLTVTVVHYPLIATYCELINNENTLSPSQLRLSAAFNVDRVINSFPITSKILSLCPLTCLLLDGWSAN